MLTIRLQRVGRKNQPVYRIVLAEKHRAATKKTVESLGLYNPRNKEFTVKEERVKYWLEKHIPLSPTVHNLFVTKKLIDAKKVHAWQPRKKAEAPVAPASPAGEPVAAAPKAEEPPASTSESEAGKAEAPATV